MIYTPAPVPVEPKDLPAYLRLELERLARIMSSPVPYALLQVSNAPPKRPLNGMLVDADGVNWNPGSGAGVYRYRSGSWVFLG